MTETYLHISAGDGPAECAWVVVQLAGAFVREGKTEGLRVEIVWSDGPTKTAPSSLLVKISDTPKAKTARDVFCSARLGTVRWIGQSPFRNHHKRRNWFVGVTRPPEPADIPGFDERDIRYQTMRASGPGGQHVNKTSSAVRATHVPTGISVTSEEERSQFANKRLSRIKLALIFEEKAARATRNAKQELWKSNKALERGNEVRVYAGGDFRRRR